jgi:hypothetical protein
VIAGGPGKSDFLDMLEIAELGIDLFPGCVLQIASMDRACLIPYNTA